MEAPVQHNPLEFGQLGEAGGQVSGLLPHLQPRTGRAGGLGTELLPDVLPKGIGNVLPARAIPKRLLTFVLGHAIEPALDRRPWSVGAQGLHHGDEHLLHHLFPKGVAEPGNAVPQNAPLAGLIHPGAHAGVVVVP